MGRREMGPRGPGAARVNQMNERRFVGFERSKSLVGGFLALSVLSAACADKRDASSSAPPMASAAAPI